MKSLLCFWDLLNSLALPAFRWYLWFLLSCAILLANAMEFNCLNAAAVSLLKTSTVLPALTPVSLEPNASSFGESMKEAEKRCCCCCCCCWPVAFTDLGMFNCSLPSFAFLLPLLLSGFNCDGSKIGELLQTLGAVENDLIPTASLVGVSLNISIVFPSKKKKKLQCLSNSVSYTLSLSLFRMRSWYWFVRSWKKKIKNYQEKFSNSSFIATHHVSLF